MARRSTTPLYEFMGSRNAPVRTPSADGEGRLDRSIRVPVGTVMMATAVVILLLIGAYVAGSMRTKAVLQRDFDAQLRSVGIDPALRASDPMTEEGLGGPLIESPPSDQASQGAGAGPAVTGDDDRTASSGAIESDPRREGLNYLVLIETQPGGALRLAGFCRDRGLEAYVISGHNPRSRRVIVLPGLPTRDESDPEVIRLRRRVNDVGTAWQSRYPGESNLSDAYFLAY